MARNESQLDKNQTQLRLETVEVTFRIAQQRDTNRLWGQMPKENRIPQEGRIELAQHAVTHMRRSVVPLFLGALGVVVLFWPTVKHGPLQVWLICALLDVLRVCLFCSHQQRKIAAGRYSAFDEIMAALHSFSFAAVWGSLALIAGLWGTERSFWLSGMIVLAAVSFATVASASSRLMFVITLAGLVTPLCVAVLLGVQQGSSLRVLVSVFIGTSVALHASIHKAIVSAVCANIESRDMAETLSKVLDVQDPLTLTFNRHGFSSWVADQISAGENCADHQELAVAVGNVERMSAINELYGAKNADLMLRALALRLTQVCGDRAAVARISGDEFLVARFVSDAVGLTDLIGQFELAISEPFVIDGQPISIGLCISGSLGDPEHVEKLVADASTKVHAARSGRSATWTKTIQPLDERRKLLDQLSDGLTSGQVRPWFQPIVGADDHRIRSWEALVRWEHPRQGLLGPDRFLELASIAGLSSALTDCVLERSVQFVRALDLTGQGTNATVHVNVSAADLRREGFAHHVGRLLSSNGMRPGQVVLEVTEQSILLFDDQVAANLHHLAVIGVPLAVDDFGTGYSSLSHLLDLRAASLKIDRRFVAALTSNHESRTLVRAVIGMARGLGLTTVAEGVETVGQAQVLLELGCDELQGFLISPALSPEGASRFARTHEPRLAVIADPIDLALTGRVFRTQR